MKRQEAAVKMQNMLIDEFRHAECKIGRNSVEDYESFRVRLDPFHNDIRDRMRELGEGFVGRDWLADAVVAELAKGDHAAPSSSFTSAAANGPSPLTNIKPLPPVVVYGDSGTGKSSFVCRVMDAQFCHKKKGSWQHLNSRILARHLCSINNDDSLSRLRWARSLAGQLCLHAAEGGKLSAATALGGHDDLPSLVDWIERQDSARHILTTWVVPLLEKLGPLNGKDTIWVDSLDEALTNDVLTGSHSTGNTIVALLIQMKCKWPSWLRIVATSRPDEQTRAALRPLTGASIDVRSKANQDDVKEFVLQELNRLQLSTAALQDTANDVESTCHSICSAAKGVMMYAREVIRQFEDFGFLDLEAPPESLTILYMVRYRKTFPRDGMSQFAAHSRPMLEMLVASRDPLPISLVSKAGYLQVATVEKEVMWNNDRRRHLDFVQRLCVGSLVEKGKLQLSHKSVADWLCDSDDSKEFHVDKQQGHIFLADTCWGISNALRGRFNCTEKASPEKETNVERRERLKREAQRRRKKNPRGQAWRSQLSTMRSRSPNMR